MAAPVTKNVPVRERSPRSVLELLQENATLLPANVTITPVDAQNTLIVTGEPEAIGQVQNLVRTLDQPYQQIEVEVRYISISPEAFNALGANSSATNARDIPLISSSNRQVTVAISKPGALRTLSAAVLNHNFATALSSLITSQQVTVLNSPRVTTYSGQEATVRSTQSLRVGADLQVLGTTGIVVKPAYDEQGVITLVVRPPGRLGVGPYEPYEPNNLSAQPHERADKNVYFPSELTVTIANLKDDDTVTVGGALAKQFENVLAASDWLQVPDALFNPDNQSKPERELVLFITARIVRRAGDAIPAPKVASLP
jgi:type II secretory pathway component GspD/PulD (secretin)